VTDNPDAELEIKWWRAEGGAEVALLLDASIAPPAHLSQRVTHAHFAFKFFLPSFNAAT
jgi:hypothetical protein